MLQLVVAQSSYMASDGEVMVWHGLGAEIEPSVMHRTGVFIFWGRAASCQLLES